MTQTEIRKAKVRPIPEGYHTLTPTLTLNDAAAAIEFYKRAFGAEEISRMVAPDGKKIWHAELKIGDSRLMLGDEFPEMGGGLSPKTLGGRTGSLFLYVEDVDAVFQRAVDAGATVTMPVADQFWGDRYGQIRDPFGHDWAFGTHIEDVTDEEIYRRAQAFATQS
jgi:PhnB protein